MSDVAPRRGRRAADRRRRGSRAIGSVAARGRQRRWICERRRPSPTPCTTLSCRRRSRRLRRRPPAVASRSRGRLSSRPGPTSAPARARPTPRSCTRASTQHPGRSSRDWSPAAMRCCATYAPSVGISVEETGALLVAWDDEQAAALPGLAAKAAANGYERAEIVDRDAVYEQRAAPRSGRTGGMLVPDEHIIDPWTTPLAFAHEAIANGATVLGQSRGDRRATSAATSPTISTDGARRTIDPHTIRRQRGRSARRRAAPLARARRLHDPPAPRRAHRVRQAGEAVC